MLTEAEIQRAVDYLRDNAEAAASARATRIYMEEYRKVVKAQIQAEQPDEPLGAQERRAYSSERYLKHLEAMRTAIADNERYRFLREAALAKIEAWRTQSANERVPV